MDMKRVEEIEKRIGRGRALENLSDIEFLIRTIKEFSEQPTGQNLNESLDVLNVPSRETKRTRIHKESIRQIFKKQQKRIKRYEEALKEISEFGSPESAANHLQRIARKALEKTHG